MSNTLSHHHSHKLSQAALNRIPSGVNSPARSFAGVGGQPIFMAPLEPIMLDGGVYLATSAYETGFTSIMHNNEVIDATLNHAEYAFKKS